MFFTLKSTGRSNWFPCLWIIMTMSSSLILICAARYTDQLCPHRRKNNLCGWPFRGSLLGRCRSMSKRRMWHPPPWSAPILFIVLQRGRYAFSKKGQKAIYKMLCCDFEFFLVVLDKDVSTTKLSEHRRTLLLYIFVNNRDRLLRHCVDQWTHSNL